MASKSFQSIHHHNHNRSSILSRRRRHSLDSPPTTLPSSRFLQSTSTTKNNTTISTAQSSTTFSLFSSTSSSSPTTATTTTTSSTSETITFNLLEQHLSAQNFRQADEETRRLLILLAGEGAKKRGYVFFSEVQFISKEDLSGIDTLWRKYSNNKFGYSVQKRIWEKVNKDFTRFFLKVGWMKRLESSEIEQYNYRSFPDEFIWELKEDSPEGHLPLTNALRGTQLLNSILSHPAFEGTKEDEGEGEEKDGVSEDGRKGLDTGSSGLKGGLSKTLFNPNYGF
ncbi:hypothetical protein Ancab_006361 [Ancistrocladus abbreviatus]